MNHLEFILVSFLIGSWKDQMQDVGNSTEQSRLYEYHEWKQELTPQRNAILTNENALLRWTILKISKLPLTSRQMDVVTSTRMLWKCLQFKSYARLMFWTRSHVAQANPIFTRDKINPELLILLPPVPRCWGHRCMPPHTVGVFFVCLLYHIYLFTYFVCTYMYITHTVACVWRSEVNFEELIVPCSHHAGLGREVSACI